MPPTTGYVTKGSVFSPCVEAAPTCPGRVGNGGGKGGNDFGFAQWV